MADDNAMQAETDEAWNSLVETMNALRLKADKSVLENLLSQMEELDLSGYTEESVSVFRAAFAAANVVLTDEALSVDDQAEVDEAVNALQAAYDGLEKTQSGEPEDPGTGSGDADEPQEPGNNPGSGDVDDTQTTDGDSGNQGGTAGDAGNNGSSSGNGSQSGIAGTGADAGNNGAAKAAKTGDAAPVAAAALMLTLSAGAVLLVMRKRAGK